MPRFVDIENCGELVEVLANTLEFCHFKHKLGCIAPDCRECLHWQFNEFNSSHLIPTADVQPVRHGHWLPCNDDNKKRCSRCDTICLIAVYPAWKKALFCPNCGAKMDGKDGEKQ